ncbi:MAG: ATP-binding protein [Candidatus Micrarchaeota archaeon]
MGNPFRPGAIVEPEYFVGRSEEIARFEQYLKNTKDGNPHHLAILGERGIGKTSLLRYLQHLAKNQRIMVARIELDPAIKSIEHLVTQILTELKRSGIAYSLVDKGAITLKDFFQKYNVALSLGVLKAGPRQGSEVETKIEFRYKLQEMWDKVKDKIPAIIIMIDEAEQLEQIEGSLHYLRNIFLRLSETHCSYMLILSGKIGLFREIKELHSPLARFFTPITLNPLKPEEVKAAIEKPLKENGIALEKNVLNRIIKDSEGHPYVVQVIGYILFESDKKLITLNDYNTLKPAFMKHLADQLFSDMLENSSTEEQRILHIIAKKKSDLSLKEISKKVNKDPTSIGTPLTRLVERSCLGRIKRGKYQLFHSLFGEYILSEMEGKD